MKDKVIGLGKPEEFSKTPWECKIKKMAVKAQRKQTGPVCPRENKWDTGPSSDIIKEPMAVLGHWEKNKR